jgi:hypothetical protein
MHRSAPPLPVARGRLSRADGVLANHRELVTRLGVSPSPLLCSGDMRPRRGWSFGDLQACTTATSGATPPEEEQMGFWRGTGSQGPRLGAPGGRVAGHGPAGARRREQAPIALGMGGAAGRRAQRPRVVPQDVSRITAAGHFCCCVSKLFWVLLRGSGRVKTRRASRRGGSRARRAARRGRMVTAAGARRCRRRDGLGRPK